MLLCLPDNMVAPAAKVTIEIDARWKDEQFDEGEASKGEFQFISLWKTEKEIRLKQGQR